MPGVAGRAVGSSVLGRRPGFIGALEPKTSCLVNRAVRSRPRTTGCARATGNAVDLRAELVDGLPVAIFRLADGIDPGPAAVRQSPVVTALHGGTLVEFDSYTIVDGEMFTTVMRPRGEHCPLRRHEIARPRSPSGSRPQSAIGDRGCVPARDRWDPYGGARTTGCLRVRVQRQALRRRDDDGLVAGLGRAGAGTTGHRRRVPTLPRTVLGGL